MSNPTPDLSKVDKTAIYILALPVLALQSAFDLTKRAITGKSAVSAELLPIQEEEPVVHNSCIPKYQIANRVHCAIMGTLKVSFYQYGSHYIQAVTRRNGQCKKVTFSPSIASKQNLPYSIDGAMQWVRQVGFKEAIDASIPVIAAKPVVPVLAAPLVGSTPQEKQSTKPVTSDYQPVKTRAFTGTIISMGESERPGKDGAPPYMTYSVKLAAQYGGLEKEFIGEHLSELVEANGLQLGQLIKLQLLGRNPFTVIVDGKEEKRNRNEYALEIL